MDPSLQGPDGGTRANGFARGLGRAVLGTWKLALAVVLVIGGVATGGFLSFVHQVQGMDVRPAAEAPRADAIVVLTGGPGRIEEGLALLSKDRSDRMLISGVNPRTSDAALRKAAVREHGTAGILDDAERTRLLACCVDTGRVARDTVGNAAEARQWIRARGYDHVIVVTADFHMQRSLLEFERALEVEDDDEAAPSAVRLTPWPVATPALRGTDWYRDPAALRRMLGEWGKYLSAQSKGWFGAEFLKQWFPDA